MAMENTLTLGEILSARRSLQELARRKRTTLDSVLREINEAIAEMRANPDPQVRAKWAESPFADRAPSPEEFIAWCAKLVREGEKGQPLRS